jgi:hypothetical protein
MRQEILSLSAEIHAFTNRMIIRTGAAIITTGAICFAIGRYVH